MADRSVVVRLRANIDDFRAGMRNAGQAAQEFGREVTGRGSATREDMERVGRSALVMSTGLVASFGLAAKAAIDWESAWAGVLKTVDGSDAQLAQLESGLRQMSATLPATHAEIAGVAEAAGQLGIETDNILGFTRTMLDLGQATNMSSDRAATALARLANITQMSQRDFDRLGSTVVVLGNNLATTEAEIVEMGLRLAGAGNQIGLTEADILGLSAALSSVGIEAEAGGSAISKVMIDIATEVETGGNRLAMFAEVAGMSADEFSRAYRTDAAGAIVTFVEGLGNMEDSGRSTIGVLAELGITEVRMRDALLRSAGAGQLMRTSLDLANQGWQENTALTAEAEQRYNTTAAQLGMLRNQVVDLGIDIGQTLLPVLRASIGVIGDVVSGFAAMPDGLRLAGMGLAGIVTVGTGVIGVAATLIPKIQDLQKSLNKMGAAGQFAARNMRNVATGSAALMAAFTALSMYTGMMERARSEGQAFADQVRNSYSRATFAEMEAALPRIGAGIQDLNQSARESVSPFDHDYRASLREAADGLQSTALGMRVQMAIAIDLADRLGITEDEALALHRATLLLGDEAESTGADLDALAASTDPAAFSAMADALGVTEEQLSEMASATRHADDAIKDYQNTLRGIMDPLFGATNALRNHEKAQADVIAADWALVEATAAYDDAVRTHGASSEEATAAYLDMLAAQEKLTDANFDVVSSAMDVDQALFTLRTQVESGGTSIDQARARLNEWVAQGLITRDQANDTAAAFEKLTEQANGVPRTLEVYVAAHGLGEVLGALGNLKTAIGSVPTAINIGANLGAIPSFDSGGVMPGPIGQHRLALVAGGETVLPTHRFPIERLASMARGDNAGGVNVTVQALTDREASRVGRKVAREIAWAQTATGVR